MGKQEQYVVIFLHLGTRAAERTKLLHLKTNLEVGGSRCGRAGPQDTASGSWFGLVWFWGEGDMVREATQTAALALLITNE